MADSIAVIVGAGPGLGAALVHRCAGEGMTVVAAARNAEDRTELQDGASAGRVHLHNCDVTSADDVARLFGFVDTLGTPELMVFNAGAFRRASVLQTDPAEFERCWRVGCLGGLLTAQAAGQRMTAAGRGTILFTGATASLRGGAGFSSLASPKFALRALAQSLAREIGPEGVHVAHVIIDGQIRSEGREELLRERGPDSLLEPKEIAGNYLALHHQHPSAWTFELDLRPWVERF